MATKPDLHLRELASRAGVDWSTVEQVIATGQSVDQVAETLRQRLWAAEYWSSVQWSERQPDRNPAFFYYH